MNIYSSNHRNIFVGRGRSGASGGGAPAEGPFQIYLLIDIS